VDLPCYRRTGGISLDIFKDKKSSVINGIQDNVTGLAFINIMKYIYNKAMPKNR
jgi:hypothetical protein